MESSNIENDDIPSDTETEEEEEEPIMEETTFKNTNDSSSPQRKYSIVPEKWEELHGNYVLRPEHYATTTDSTISSPQPPRALIHFLGGAFIGAAPDVAYRYILERLAEQGYLIVATPYNLSFDYLTTCDDILDKFERIAPMLARQYGPVPVVGVGHSCGALLHLLITTLFPDTPRAANALLSYNNKDVKDAVPLFDTFVAPLFQTIAGGGNETSSSSGGGGGVESIQLLNELVKTTLDGEIPSDEKLLEFTESLLPPPLQSKKPSPLNNDNNQENPSPIHNILTNLITIPAPVRETLQTSLLHPFTSTLSQTSLLPPIYQTIDVLDQLPLLIQEVANGATEFNPPRSSIQAATKRAYRARRTLLIQYLSDTIDESPIVENLLKEAETVMRMKRPMVQMDLQRVELEGNHATPVLAPPGVEFVNQLENVLGREGSSSSGGKTTEKSDDSGESDNSSTVGVRTLYKQADETVDVLVRWLEEGQL